MPGHVQRGESSRNTSQATQTASTAPNGHVVDPALRSTTSKTSKTAHGQSNPSPKKSRRRDAKELRLAARARRRQTEAQNLHNPPKPEDIWICEFCEYESIFGGPPAALVRQYEIKDRKLRQQEEERRRLLEKAKMRSRKGRKGKAPAKSSNPAQDRNPPHGGNEAAHMHSNNSQETQSEEYDEEEYDEEEEFGPDEMPPLEDIYPAGSQPRHAPGPGPGPGPGAALEVYPDGD